MVLTENFRIIIAYFVSKKSLKQWLPIVGIYMGPQFLSQHYVKQ